MTRPHSTRDLLLAPVAVEIDINLQQLRDRDPAGIAESIALSLNVDPRGAGREQRTAWIRECAIHTVDLHDWDAQVTDDGARLRLEGGSVSIDLGLSASVLRYITDGD